MIPGRTAEDDGGAPDTSPPELRALLDRGDPERGGARLDEGARRRDRAVPVPVGLDDREHLHARTDEVPGGAEIRAQRPEAHLGDRGPTLDVVHTQRVGGNFPHIKWANKVRAAETLAAAEARGVVPGGGRLGPAVQPAKRRSPAEALSSFPAPWSAQKPPGQDVLDVASAVEHGEDPNDPTAHLVDDPVRPDMDLAE